MNNPKILLSINTAWNIANFRSGLIRGLHHSGYDVICAAPPDNHVHRIEALDCQFIPLPIDNKGTSPAKDAALTLRYLDIFRQHRPSIFMGYTIKPNVYGTIAASILGIPAINNVSGLGTAFIREDWITRIVHVLYRTAFNNSSTVFFQNGDDRELFVKRRLVKSHKAEILPGSGIDLAYFRPDTAISPATGGPVFLLIARMLRDKGVVEFVEAARIVKKAYPKVRMQLLGFLDVENRTAISREEMDRWVKEGVIEYLGTTDDVRPFIAAADCVVLPSYREGTPRTLLEAAAMGKPLIATDVPGCREVVIDGLNGHLCEVCNASDLAEKIEIFLALSNDDRHAMGKASRRLAEERYDEKFVIEAYLRAIRRALRI